MLEWSGTLTRYNFISDDRWRITAATEPRHNALPLPLKWQKYTAPGHDGAITGLANITDVWGADNHLWGTGLFDADDQEAEAFARKIKGGFLNQVSVDLTGCTIKPGKDDNGPYHDVVDWNLSSSTVCADPKFPTSRLTVTEPVSAAAAHSDEFAEIVAHGDGQITMSMNCGNFTINRESITGGGTPTPQGVAARTAQTTPPATPDRPSGRLIQARLNCARIMAGIDVPGAA